MSTETRPDAATLRRMILGYRLSQALHVAARLEIAELLAGGPKSIDELAGAAEADPPSLYRLLRLLAGEGVFEELADGRFAQTPLSEMLRGDHDLSLRARAVFDGDEGTWRAWGNLLHSVRTGTSAFDHALGTGLFDYLKENPEASADFDALMAEQTGHWTGAIAAAYDFAGLETVVDVGGGNGALLAGLLGAHPDLRGVVFDQPHVVAGAPRILEAAGLSERCRIAEGDFFDSVPGGGDAYLLKFILHDWGDEDCAAVLKNCRRAMAESGRLLVIEILVEPGNTPDYGRYLDLHMLVVAKGRERSEDEYRALFRAGGFALTRVVPTGTDLSILEGWPV